MLPERVPKKASKKHKERIEILVEQRLPEKFYRKKTKCCASQKYYSTKAVPGSVSQMLSKKSKTHCLSKKIRPNNFLRTVQKGFYHLWTGSKDLSKIYGMHTLHESMSKWCYRENSESR